MFFIPLYDDNPTARRPFITWIIMAICIGIFIHQSGLGGRAHALFIDRFAAHPHLISGGEALATLITSAFLHGGWLHLGGNMLYLWIFGDNVEDRFGHVRFVLFYLACGAAASLAHVLTDPGSTTPLVGASGAIAGVLAAYLLMFPRAKVRVLVVILIFIRWITMPAFVVLLGWLLLQLIAAPASLASSGGGVAYFAHIGGFAAGLILTPFLRRREAPKREPEHHGHAGRGQLHIASAREVKSEFVNRYKRKNRTAIPQAKRRN